MIADRLAFLVVLLLVSVALAAAIRRARQEGAAAERERIDAEARAQLERRNEVAQGKWPDGELQKRLRDGTF